MMRRLFNGLVSVGIIAAWSFVVSITTTSQLWAMFMAKGTMESAADGQEMQRQIGLCRSEEEAQRTIREFASRKPRDTNVWVESMDPKRQIELWVQPTNACPIE